MRCHLSAKSTAVNIPFIVFIWLGRIFVSQDSPESPVQFRSLHHSPRPPLSCPSLLQRAMYPHSAGAEHSHLLRDPTKKNEDHAYIIAVLICFHKCLEIYCSEHMYVLN